MTPPRLLTPGQRVLAIAPHPDDETFGCGGTLARAVAAGCEVHVLAISIARELRHANAAHPSVSGAQRRSEFEAAMQVLGVRHHAIAFEDDAVHMRLDAMSRLDLVAVIERDASLSLRAVEPDVVLFPEPSYNQDHAAVHEATLAACRPHHARDKPFATCVLSYEQPQLAWGRAAFTPDLHVDISAFAETKLRALACYASQLREDPHPSSLANAERLARLRGAEVCLAAAETFRCHRLVL